MRTAGGKCARPYCFLSPYQNDRGASHFRCSICLLIPFHAPWGSRASLWAQTWNEPRASSLSIHKKGRSTWPI
ncbi:MAG: hypothetical protein C4532_00255 [Candidatus Abyssobacteria bacterium SURF_17]|uniref:Uncharacterized protein n=1 Tax=Candidatus Abyssobacteria bacterium SURF_17 TaxID=2093361 RepID=A0A419FAA0_9BACT|nr:MAG: hypothetical protein C4532_00255 [Candidatus Abyssubacteria bacterium SURF_17]